MMDKEKEQTPQNLLSVDLNSIVTEGQKLQRKRRNALTLAVIVLAFACVISVVVYKMKVAQTYHAAITAQENGEYELAIDLFRGLGDYQNSQEELERTVTAIKIREAPVCEALVSAVEELDMQIAVSLPAIYDLGESTITITTYLQDNAIDFNNLTHSGYKKWTNICDFLKKITGAVEVAYLEECGYDVKCEIILLDSFGNLLYSVKSGDETYTFKSKDRFEEELERDKEQIEKEEKYQLAISHEEAMHYTYAKVLFEEIMDYRDAKEHYDRMIEVLKPYNGTYRITAFTGAKYTMTLQDGEGILKWDLSDGVVSIEILGYDFNGKANNISTVFTVNGYSSNNTTLIDKNWYYGEAMDVYSIHIDENGKVMIFACEGNEFTTYNGSGTKG